MMMGLESHADDFVIGLQVRAYNWCMRQSRQAKHLTQTQLAELAGTHQGLISDLELMRIPPGIEWDTLDRIAQILDETTARLFPTWLKGRDLADRIHGDVPIRLTEDMASDLDLTERAIQAQLYARLRECVATLPEKSRRVIILRFGLNGESPQTLQAIAKECGVTREYIRELEATGLKYLRHPSRSGALREMMDG